MKNNPFQGTGKDDDLAIGKWYWYDETGDIEGPYDTKEKAQERLDKYIRWLEIGQMQIDIPVEGGWNGKDKNVSGKEEAAQAEHKAIEPKEKEEGK